MKKTDIAMLILIASVAVLVTFFIGNSLPFLKPSEEGVKVKTVTAISEDIEEPDTTVFNENAINPTVEVVVGGGSNQE